MTSSSLRSGVRSVLIGLTIFGCTEVWGADWKKLASYAEGHYYYDTKSIYSSAEGNLRVLSKWVFSEKQKIENLKTYGTEQENVTHWLIFMNLTVKIKKSEF